MGRGPCQSSQVLLDSFSPTQVRSTVVASRLWFGVPDASTEGTRCKIIAVTLDLLHHVSFAVHILV
jgi:hypothetical protein